MTIFLQEDPLLLIFFALFAPLRFRLFAFAFQTTMILSNILVSFRYLLTRSGVVAKGCYLAAASYNDGVFLMRRR